MRATLAVLISTLPGLAAAAPLRPPLTGAEILEQAPNSDFRRPRAEDTLYLELPQGRVIIELAPAMAPAHVGNIRALATGSYFDGLAILRTQDNYVVQWGDPEGENPGKARSLGAAQRHLPAEFIRKNHSAGFVRHDEADVYAPEVGWFEGFPAARDRKKDQLWLAHCYGMVGAGRNDAPDSSNGAELYVVIGHSPRHLDRNITLVGRVLLGMELLSSLPRGPAPLGFYTTAEQRLPIRSVKLASQVPAADRVPVEVLRTDSPTFKALVRARKYRREKWFAEPVGHVELCNVTIPARISR